MIFQNADICHALTFCVSILLFGCVATLAALMVVDNVLRALNKQSKPLKGFIERIVRAFSNKYDYMNASDILKENLLQVPIFTIYVFSLFNIFGSEMAHDFTLMSIFMLSLYGAYKIVGHFKRQGSNIINLSR